MLPENVSNIAGEYGESQASVKKIDGRKKEASSVNNRSDLKGKENAERRATKKEIQNAVDYANKQAKIAQTSCEFTYNEKINRISIKVKNRETDEIIKEIPADESLERIEKMLEFAGILVDEKG